VSRGAYLISRPAGRNRIVLYNGLNFEEDAEIEKKSDPYQIIKS